MATFGSVSSESTIPSAGFAFQGLNVNTQAWSNFTMPTPGGRVTVLHVYFDADVASGTGTLVLWNSGTGNIIASVSAGSIPVGSQSAGGQAWHHATLAGFGTYVPGGTSVSIGFWMPGSSGFIISSITGGSSSWNGVSFSSAGNQSGAGSTGIGTIGAFADYVPCLRKVRTLAGAWVESPVRVRTLAGAWVIGPRFIRTLAGAWVQVQ